MPQIIRFPNDITNPSGITAARYGYTSGTMAAGLGAGSSVATLRNPSSTKLLIVDRVSFDGAGSIAGFTAGVAIFQLFFARSFTAEDTGGTAFTLTGNNNKLRTSLATVAATARVATTAGLAAGTRTLDSQPLATYVGSFPATAGASLPPYVMFDREAAGDHPIVLAQNEGLLLAATVPATGTWTFGMSIDVQEVVSL